MESLRRALCAAVFAVAAPGAVAQDPPPVPTATPRSPKFDFDVQLALLAAVGSSTASDAELALLQAGLHDPRQRGFTLQEAEIGFVGRVEEWLSARAYLIAAIEPLTGETIVELEEAYVSTESLPSGWTVEAGSFFTDFGRMNRLHPHQWQWLDQPIALSRMFGGDGLRGPGARVLWRPPSAERFGLSFGVQNASGETMTSFLANEEVYEERGIGGRFFTAREMHSLADLFYSLRVTADLPLGAATLGLGASAALGPNATGDGADTVLYGVDFLVRGAEVAHDDHAHAGFLVQGEFLARAFDAAAQVDEQDPLAPVALPAETLADYGGYLQVSAPIGERWRLGLRGEWVSGDGASYDAGSRTFARAADPFRADRLRISPLLAFAPSERSRLRLQYSYDDSDHLADEQHSVWLGVEVLIGTGTGHRH